MATLGQILDERANLALLEVNPKVADSVRNQFYDHLKVLPDACQIRWTAGREPQL